MAAPVSAWNTPPALRGGVLALLAAALFGISTPLVQKFGVGLGAFTTAALLYAGAALVGALSRRPAAREAQLRRQDLPVLAATAAWGVDNTLSRKLAERDPSQVVMGKALLGASAAAAVALTLAEPMPALSAALALALIGATGYGLSLRLYLLAQRAFGAGRTGSVYAFAPFIGAACAVALGDRMAGWLMPLGGLLMLLGMLLHLAERHEHAHVHGARDHEHAHRHDDGHHDHVHEPMPAGTHSHAHHHPPLRHAHAHVPDAHHTHRH